MTLALEAFSEWIVGKGGSILQPTNEWEVLRYKTADNKLGVIYRNKREQHTFTDQVKSDYPSFIKDLGLAPTERIERFKGEKNARLKARLLERDGDLCCYCGQFMDKPTLEHFHAVSRHGTNHEDNCALACEPCNRFVADLPVIKKIALRDRIRAAVAITPPWMLFDARDLA